MNVKLNRVKKLVPRVLLTGLLASAMFLSIVGCQAKTAAKAKMAPNTKNGVKSGMSTPAKAGR